MRSRAIIAVIALAGALVSGGWLLQRGADGGPASYGRARLFDDVLNHVARYYVDTLAHDELYRHAVDGMLKELEDPHSVFLPPERLKTLTESTTGRYGGVGIQIEPRSGWITVVAPLPDTPAERAGVQTGDRIVEIEGKTTHGWTAEEAQKALRGTPGSKVRFMIERPGHAERIPINITRREIQIRAVQHAMLLRDDIGYLDVNVFSETTADELREEIDRLRKQGMRKMIVDLRNNPGGLLDQGVSVADLFLAPGQEIVSMRGRTRDANRSFTDRQPQRWPELPIVVLIDSGSASASEIVAGALQDHDRAALIGTTTFGKGSAQSLFPMSGGGALKLTTALWYTPVGRSINRPTRITGFVDAEDPSDEERAERDTTPRETFLTDGGRKVLGGGGITPDLIVGARLFTERELAFQQAIGEHVQPFLGVLAEYAASLKASRAIADRDFEVTPAMMDELWRRMQRRGVDISRATFDDGAALISQRLGAEVARYVFGREAEFRRNARQDRMIQTAIDLLSQGSTPKEVVGLAGTRQAMQARADSSRS